MRKVMINKILSIQVKLVYKAIICMAVITNIYD